MEPHKVVSTGSQDVPDQARSPAPLKPPRPQGVDSVPPPPDVSTLGKFQLLALLGKGGMGEVYLALSRGSSDSNKLVVIKRLSPSIAVEPAFREMFLDEGRLAVRLNHPNVVQTYEVVADGTTHFLVMEYLEGQPLVRMMKSLARAGKKLPPEIAISIVAQALSGLQYAHELTDYDGTPINVVHRDLSPHNIFITYEGVVKLVDFGIAKAAMNSSQTQAGMFKGKPSYMAPEQFVGSVDARADLFTVGVVLWEMLTHQRLANTEDSVKAVAELLGGPAVRRVSSAVPSIDPRLDGIVARSLEKERDNRFQTAAEMREALVEYGHASGRRGGQDEVSRLMRELFAKKRESVRKVIQSYVRNPPPVNLDTSALLAIGSLGTVAPITTTGGLQTGSGVMQAPPSGASVTSQERPASRSRPVLLLAGAAAVVVAGVAYFGFGGSRTPASPATAETGATAVASAIAIPPLPSTAATAPTAAPPATSSSVNAPPDADGHRAGSDTPVRAASDAFGSRKGWAPAPREPSQVSPQAPSPPVVVAAPPSPGQVKPPPAATSTPPAAAPQGRVFRTEL